MPIPGGGRRPKPARGTRAPANGVREVLSDVEPEWMSEREVVEECGRRWGREPEAWARGLHYLVRKGEVVPRKGEDGEVRYQSLAIHELQGETAPAPAAPAQPRPELERPPKPPEPRASTPHAGTAPRALTKYLCAREKTVMHVEVLPARPAVHDSRPPDLPPALRRCFPPDHRFFSHQGAAIRLAEAGRNVVVATGTSSGKTHCYNVPVLKTVLQKPGATALYVFPTKALAQDQLKTLRALIDKTGAPIEAHTYDGDTPQAEKDAIRNGRRANILITTPEMLNRSLLAHHGGAWRWFFERLHHVVIDEVHTYRGIFGSHFANLMLRLKLIVRRHTRPPTFICCSATIANAKEFVEKLCGLPFVLVDADGSPKGERTVIFWNPPLRSDPSTKPAHEPAAEPTREPSFIQTIHLLTLHVERDVRTIAFMRSRKLTERVYRGVTAHLRKANPRAADRVASYRGGYSAVERREIEGRLFNGELAAVVTTNALELGVDVGSLDAVIITGFPGTIASFWQQAGRAGRGGREACITFVADEDALNQYWMANPREFFSRSHEHAIINPENPYVLDAHVACAVKEVSPSEVEAGSLGDAFAAALARLEENGLVKRVGGRWRWMGTESPQHAFNLRNVGDDVYAVLDRRGKPVGDPVERARVFRDLHPGAIHYHKGDSYLVEDLDIKGRRVILTEHEAGYRTEPMTQTDVRVLAKERTRRAGALDIHHGQVRVTQQVTGYVRLDERGELLGEEEMELPEVVLDTKALWFELSAEDRDAMMKEGRDVAGSLHAAEHALIAATPLLAMCDRWDLGGVSYGEYPATSRPAVFLYDGYPGGVGITETDYERFDGLVQRALQMVEGCACKSGCPACVHSPKCGNRNKPLDKQGAIDVLRRFLAQPSEGTA